jgi:DNA polymerase V
MISRAVPANFSIGESIILRPLFLSGVQAGYPSPADDEVEERLDLSRHISKNPEATMMVWMRGDGFSGEGVYDGDLLVADSSVRPREGNLVVVRVGGEQLVKKVTRHGGALYMVDGGGPSEMLELKDSPEVQILAVVTFTIHTIPERR